MYAKAFGMNPRIAVTAPPGHRTAISTDKNVARANPITAANCGVLKMLDPTILGREIMNTRIARISSTR
jgi:hypothetical protein